MDSREGSGAHIHIKKRGGGGEAGVGGGGGVGGGYQCLTVFYILRYLRSGILLKLREIPCQN